MADNIRYEIHHKDMDYLNKDYDNLVLLTVKEHRQLHALYKHHEKNIPSTKTLKSELDELEKRLNILNTLGINIDIS